MSRPAASLSTVPPEILHYILTFMPIPSLLSFGATSRQNYAHHLQTLHALHLAVFPKRVQSLIAFLQHSSTSSPSNLFDLDENQIAITLPNRPSRKCTPKSYRLAITTLQNAHLTTLLNRYGPALHILTFHAWDIQPGTASALATRCARLKHLSLCFDHSASRDPCIPAGYFDAPVTPSPLWNALAGLGAECEQRLLLRGLVSLKLERAGCTSAQLRGIIARNPGLEQLRLRKVAGVDAEFVAWLGSSGSAGEVRNPRRDRLTLLLLEDCRDLYASRPEHLLWVWGLPALKTLGFGGCANVDGRMLRELNEQEWRIPELVGWSGKWRAGEEGSASLLGSDGVLEVDEACL